MTPISVIDSVWAALSANQFLAGGIGTVAFGSAMYVLRAVPGRIAETLDRSIWPRSPSRVCRTSIATSTDAFG